MTRPGHHPLDKNVLRQIARLMHLHLRTHPERIARRYGISVSYVRQCWRQMEVAEMASLQEALEVLNSEER